MKRYVIETGSVTYAIKARDALRLKGRKAHIERKKPSAGSSGCGYSVVCDGEFEKIKAILENAGVKYSGIKEI